MATQKSQKGKQTETSKVTTQVEEQQPVLVAITQSGAVESRAGDDYRATGLLARQL